MYARPWMSLKTAFSLVAAASAVGCASLSGIGGSAEDQLTAAITDFRESTPGHLTIADERLARFRVAPDGASAPEVHTDGHHPASWLDRLIGSGAVNAVCEAPAGCVASTTTTVVSLSAPYDGRAGAFVDARVESVTPVEGGSIRETRLIRLQIERESSGWRVVASTPIWETMG